MMKHSRRKSIEWMLILFTMMINGCGNRNDNTADDPSDSTVVLGIEQAVRSLDADTTIVTVEGVVQTISADEHLLTLIDIEEYKLCGLSDCCLYLPVAWQGEMPEIEDVVIARGQIKATDAVKVFSAQELRVIEVPGGS